MSGALINPNLFSRTGDEDFSKYIKALIAGAPKSGKTHLLGTVPGILICDTEPHANNLETVRHLDLPTATILKSQDLKDVAIVLGNDSLRQQMARQRYGLDDIYAVSIDTMDTLQKILKRERMDDQKSRTFERDDWGWLKTEMEKIVEAFTALPMHVFFTVHLKTSEIGSGKDRWTKFEPGLEGAIASSIAGMVGYSIMTFRQEDVDEVTGQATTHYLVRTEGNKTHDFLGTRTGIRGLPTVIAPDMGIIHGVIEEGRAAVKAAREARAELPPAEDLHYPVEPIPGLPPGLPGAQVVQGQVIPPQTQTVAPPQTQTAAPPQTQTVAPTAVTTAQPVQGQVLPNQGMPPSTPPTTAEGQPTTAGGYQPPPAAQQTQPSVEQPPAMASVAEQQQPHPVQPAAQTVSQDQQVQTPVETPEQPSPAEGSPANAANSPHPTAENPNARPGDAEPVNAAALGHLKRIFDACGLPFPEDLLKAKTMGQARELSTTWKAILQDHEEGKAAPGTTAASDMTPLLHAAGLVVEAAPAAAAAPVMETLDINAALPAIKGYVGNPPVLARVQEVYDAETAKGDKARKTLVTKMLEMGAKPPAEPTAPEPDEWEYPEPEGQAAPPVAATTEPVAQPVAQPTPEQVQTPVEQQVEQPAQPVTPPMTGVDTSGTGTAPADPAEPVQAGGVQSLQIVVGTPCSVCGNGVDDVDLAELGVKRFGAIFDTPCYLVRAKPKN